ncbi:MAG: hypothetical protein KKA64_03580 [Nanoarchaeota archaeon]|nr:hypothetical protein [Nanoarchaeota archaeon]
MTKLKKCKSCGGYTLKKICGKCKQKTSDAHYEYLGIKTTLK